MMHWHFQPHKHQDYNLCMTPQMAQLPNQFLCVRLGWPIDLHSKDLKKWSLADGLGMPFPDIHCWWIIGLASCPPKIWAQKKNQLQCSLRILTNFSRFWTTLKTPVQSDFNIFFRISICQYRKWSFLVSGSTFLHTEDLEASWANFCAWYSCQSHWDVGTSFQVQRIPYLLRSSNLWTTHDILQQ